ncbi:tetratricopeptide repeat protein [Actinoplanes sp. CA-030573]|uniref:tetratricopeptide repeat protein n=1 Tax=Actinoplanes sp. CA-030573 TaxID=3239898 RepID=UPI003D919775
MFGELVRAHRRRLGLTQEELAERAGVSVRSIGKWEAGRVAAPRLFTLRVLADAFALSGDSREEFLGAGTVGGDDIPPAQLPLDPAGFTGRDRELAHLDALAAGAAGRGVIISAVSGTAGVGKTALAVRWAHRVRDRFPDGQLYVNLRGFGPSGPPLSPSDALRGFLDGLGVPPQRIPADLAARAALYRSALAGRRMLILLDNAGDAEQVRPLLPGVPGCVVVVTSRDRLAGLSVTDGAQLLLLDVLTAEGARSLLARRIGADRVRAEPQAADEIVKACARLPLALAIVAARAAAHPAFSLHAIAAELRETRLDVLAGPDPATDVRAVFSWSYRRLSPPASRLFRLLGVHPSPVSGAGALAALAGIAPAAIRPLVAELVAANLLAEPQPGRFGCHDLLREYARDLASPEAGDAVGRVLDYYLHTALRADRLLKPDRGLDTPVAYAAGVTLESFGDRAAAMAWFAAEQQTLRAACDRAEESGLDTYVWWLAWAVLTYHERRWDKRNWIGWQLRAAAAAARAGDPLFQAISHYNVGYAYSDLGDLGNAREHLTRSLALYERLGDLGGMAKVHLNLGIVARRLDDYDGAIASAHTAMSLYRRAGDPVGEARATNNLGWCYLTMGDHERALDHCRRAVEVHEKAGNRMGAGHSWDSVGMACFHLGRFDEAADCYRRSLAAFRAERDRQYEAIVLNHLGDAEHGQGRARPARDAWRQSLDILTEIDHPDADEVRAKLGARPPASQAG